MRYLEQCGNRGPEQKSLLFKKFGEQKPCTVFLSSYKNTSRCFGERIPMLWEQEPQPLFPIFFEFSQTLTSVSITR